MFSRKLVGLTRPSYSRAFSAITKEVQDHLTALGITNPNIVYNPR